MPALYGGRWEAGGAPPWPPTLLGRGRTCLCLSAMPSCLYLGELSSSPCRDALPFPSFIYLHICWRRGRMDLIAGGACPPQCFGASTYCAWRRRRGRMTVPACPPHLQTLFFLPLPHPCLYLPHAYLHHFPTPLPPCHPSPYPHPALGGGPLYMLPFPDSARRILDFLGPCPFCLMTCITHTPMPVCPGIYPTYMLPPPHLCTTPACPCLPHTLSSPPCPSAYLPLPLGDFPCSYLAFLSATHTFLLILVVFTCLSLAL